MIGRLLRALVSAEVVGLVLIVAALQSLTFGIAASLENTDTRYFFWVCFLAASLGWALRKGSFRGIQASAAMVTMGILGVWILGARLISPLLDLVQALLHAIPQIVPAIRSNLPIDTEGIVEAWRIIAAASTALFERLRIWLWSLDGNVQVYDALVRNMIWLVILWLCSAWMGWFSARRHALAALLPSIILLAVVISYSERRVETLWLLVFVLILLLGLWNYRNHTIHWDRSEVDYSESIRYDLSQAVILLAVGIGGLALITPSISWRQIRDYLRERNQNEVAEMLGVQQQQLPATKAPGLKPSLPRDHLLTGGSAQSEEIVMLIRTGELPAVASRGFPVDAPRYYWRSVIYDTYVGAGWVTSAVIPQDTPADTPLIPGLLEGYKMLQLDVEMLQPEGRLFWSGILFSADVPLRADWRVRPQSDLFADQSALLQADMFAAVSGTRAYTAQSYVPLATIEELQNASTRYPEEIRERYLRLPNTVPARVRELAQEITKDQTTAYDKAKALEAYLRTYPYDLDIPAPPEERDVADYFLFDLKKGYCDYYASAMVVLARSSGLPARFVSGYASGSYDAATAQYIVRELHAHSWAEVYFPEIGWIEFEPTASQPEVELAEKSEVTVSPPSDSVAAQLLNRFRLQTMLFWLSPLAVVLIVCTAYFTLIERWLYLRITPTLAIERIYRRLYRWGRPLAGERTRAETAEEFRQKLVKRIDAIKEHSRSKKLWVNAKNEVELLSNIYQDTLFRHNLIQRKDVRTALNAWKRLRLRFVIARFAVMARRSVARREAISTSIKGMLIKAKGES